jgi:hypothetical protein
MNQRIKSKQEIVIAARIFNIEMILNKKRTYISTNLFAQFCDFCIERVSFIKQVRGNQIWEQRQDKVAFFFYIFTIRVALKVSQDGVLQV